MGPLVFFAKILGGNGKHREKICIFHHRRRIFPVGPRHKVPTRNSYDTNQRNAIILAIADACTYIGRPQHDVRTERIDFLPFLLLLSRSFCNWYKCQCFSSLRCCCSRRNLLLLLVFLFWYNCCLCCCLCYVIVAAAVLCDYCCGCWCCCRIILGFHINVQECWYGIILDSSPCCWHPLPIHVRAKVCLEPLPFVLFGALSIAAGLLALLLPETRDKILPETMEEGEAFGK